MCVLRVCMGEGFNPCVCMDPDTAWLSSAVCFWMPAVSVCGSVVQPQPHQRHQEDYAHAPLVPALVCKVLLLSCDTCATQFMLLLSVRRLGCSAVAAVCTAFCQLCDTTEHQGTILLCQAWHVTVTIWLLERGIAVQNHPRGSNGAQVM